jgi:hypothetical protein
MPTPKKEKIRVKCDVYTFLVISSLDDKLGIALKNTKHFTKSFLKRK